MTAIAASAWLVIVGVLGLRHEAEENLQFFDLQRIAALRSGLASTANTGWMGDVDISSPGKAGLKWPATGSASI